MKLKNFTARPAGAALDRAWVLANHKFMSLHAAALFPYYIDSIAKLFGEHPAQMKLPIFGFEVIFFIIMTYVTWHLAVTIHELGHYLVAVKAKALHEPSQSNGEAMLKKSFTRQIPWFFGMFVKIPWDKFEGIKKTNGTFKPNGPTNLRVSAAGPVTSGYMALIAVGIAAVLMILGYVLDTPIFLYVARPFLGLAVVGGLDLWRADPGQMKMYRQMQARARQKAETVAIAKEQKRWIDEVAGVKEMLLKTRRQTLDLGGNLQLKVPWPFRNSGMGGAHTEKEYPESNISMQETMFLPITWDNYEENQRITVELQTRLKEIIEAADGARVMGIGLEGGLAAYIEKDAGDILPEQRLWRMARQTIEECGYQPGRDVVLALDPALSELTNAYRVKFDQPDSIGDYLAWRDKEQLVLSREDVMEIYRKTIEEDDIPIVSIEDGFGEDDYDGWKLIMREMGDKILIIGDDLVTTKDSTIERSADEKWTNTTLIKANQIGTLTETMLAILVSLGKGLENVVSHRSKSPNDDMEAQIALAANTLGLKAGGGANTERLVKYGSVMKLVKEAQKYGIGDAALSEEMAKAAGEQESSLEAILDRLEITDVTSYEEATNAGIPTVGVSVSVGIKGSSKFRKLLTFTGSTPLGTSAGTDEAIHLVDSIVEKSQLTDKYSDLFVTQEDGTFRFGKGVNDRMISGKNDKSLIEMWNRAQRYGGKGCLNAADNVATIISGVFLGRRLRDLGSIVNIDGELLQLEWKTAIQRNKVAEDAGKEERIAIMQRKGNLGMNAILSTSLALCRLRASVEGKHFWQLMREEMSGAMTRIIEGTAGDDWYGFLSKGLDVGNDTLVIDSAVLDRAKQESGKAADSQVWEILVGTLSFEDLVLGLRMVNAAKDPDVRLYELIRSEIPVYEID